MPMPPPRAGLAFKLNDKTVLRAGYGIYFNVLETTFIGLTRFNPPLLRTFYAANPTFPNLAGQAQAGLPSGIVLPNQSSATPYAQHLNVALEREMFRPGSTPTSTAKSAVLLTCWEITPSRSWRSTRTAPRPPSRPCRSR